MLYSKTQQSTGNRPVADKLRKEAPPYRRNGYHPASAIQMRQLWFGVPLIRDDGLGLLVRKSCDNGGKRSSTAFV